MILPKHSNVVITAAGKSSRAGQPKGLIHTPKGESWLSYQTRNLKNLKFQSITLVLGHHQDNYRLEIDEEKLDLRVAINPAPDRGPFSSLQTGLKEFENQFVFYLPLDVPCPNLEVFQKLSEKMEQSQAWVCTPHFQRRGGHPVLFSPDAISWLLKLDPLLETSRLDFLLAELTSQQKQTVQVNDPKIRLNLNTRDEFFEFFTTYGKTH